MTIRECDASSFAVHSSCCQSNIRFLLVLLLQDPRTSPRFLLCVKVLLEITSQVS